MVLAAGTIPTLYIWDIFAFLSRSNLRLLIHDPVNILPSGVRALALPSGLIFPNFFEERGQFFGSVRLFFSIIFDGHGSTFKVRETLYRLCIALKS